MKALLDAWEALFDADRPPGRYRRGHYLLLALILIVAAWLRLRGLGAVGLHGDEETMALAVRAILDSGWPTLPSGNLYPRALTHLYLMAGSVAAFGESEWSLRLPSAIAGTLAVALAALLGRRFLSPGYGVAFAAGIALLPELIETSHTARMYIFHVAAVMAFAAAVFRWERSEGWPSAIAALLLMAVGLELHPLAVFALPIALYPLVVRPDVRRAVQAGVIVCGSMLMFVAIRRWHAMHYSMDEGPADGGFSAGVQLTLGTPVLVVTAVMALAGIGYLVRAGRGRRIEPVDAAGRGLLALALLATAVVSLPLAGVFFLCGAMLCLRTHRWREVIVSAGAVGVMAALHAAALWSSASPAPVGEVVKFLIAVPSPVPYFRFASYFPLAVLAYVALLAVIAVRFVRGAPLPGHVLFFILAVWGPLVAIGFFSWTIPPRYTLGLVPFFALCLIAAVQTVQETVRSRHPAPALARPAATWALAVAAVASMVPPAAFIAASAPSYGDHPDHKGAAQYMRELGLAPGDVVIAEDVLQQTYYLGAVDYWLRHMRDARPFLRWDGSRLVDWYTATPVIGDAEALRALLSKPDRGAVYVIGSAEGYEGRGYRLGAGILALFEQVENDVVFIGRDGVTRIWRFPPPSAPTPVSAGADGADGGPSP
jgi:4-amino-4-deoxy-L-arabinose transferase-like glycosyltransferase